eukprot:763574-Hanusia_phi.AAC.3
MHDAADLVLVGGRHRKHEAVLSDGVEAVLQRACDPAVFEHCVHRARHSRRDLIDLLAQVLQLGIHLGR